MPHLWMHPTLECICLLPSLSCVTPSGLPLHPHSLVFIRLAVGHWRPKEPLLAVPLNMTDAYKTWQQLDEAVTWMNKWAGMPKPVAWKGM